MCLSDFDLEKVDKSLLNENGRLLGDPEFDPIWAELDRLGAVVFIHPSAITIRPPDDENGP